MDDSNLTFRQTTLNAIDRLKLLKEISDPSISKLITADKRTVWRLRRGDSIGADLLERLYSAVLQEIDKATSSETLPTDTTPAESAAAESAA